MTTAALDSIAVGTYTVDAANSRVAFAVKHMGISTVRGEFKAFAGTVEIGSGLTLQGIVEVPSISTGDQEHDEQLQGPAFFDSPRFPQITFVSTGAQAGADGKLTLNGEITIKGTTKSIELSGSLGESGVEPGSAIGIGFEVEGKIDRREFDLKWNQTLPNGNLMIANEVKLIVTVSALKNA